jgi:hypothetical protein
LCPHDRDLHNNKLTGPIPPQIGRLRRLKILYTPLHPLRSQVCLLLFLILLTYARSVFNFIVRLAVFYCPLIERTYITKDLQVSSLLVTVVGLWRTYPSPLPPCLDYKLYLTLFLRLESFGLLL